MKVKIQVVIESEDGRVQDVEEVACLKRGSLKAAELGLKTLGQRFDPTVDEPPIGESRHRARDYAKAGS